MKLALAIAVFLLSSVYTQSLVLAEEPEHHKIIVIGAGISGLAAANQLKELGSMDVVILEARDRYGGRMLTDRSTEYPLDLGASWIHGIYNNPITELANKYGAKYERFDNEESIIIYDHTGNEINEERDKKLWDRFDQFKIFYEKEREDIIKNNRADIPLEDVIAKFIHQNPDMEEQDLRDFYFAIVWEIEGENGANASDLSTSFFTMGYKMGQGKPPEVIFPNGYDKITTELSKGLDIRNKTIVKEIDYDDELIRIKTTDDKEFSANYVISTIPLGILQNKDSVVFSPDLPPNKQKAIDSLGVGLLHKVYFVFETPFWDEYDWIGHIPEERGHWTYFANLYNVTGKPILLAFNSANFGRELEKRYDAGEDIAKEGLETLRTIYPDTYQDPIYTNVTTWGTDEFSHGAYSYIKVGSSNADFYKLSIPLKNKIFFAGEASEVRYPATVHGAYLSGIREALRIQALENGYSPLQQIQNGQLPEYVVCKKDLSPVLSKDAKSTACVKDTTKEELLKREWTCKKDLEQILEISNKTISNCETNLLTYDGYWKDVVDKENYED